jgi:hypothetical protein
MNQMKRSPTSKLPPEGAFLEEEAQRGASYLIDGWSLVVFTVPKCTRILYLVLYCSLAVLSFFGLNSLCYSMLHTMIYDGVQPAPTSDKIEQFNSTIVQVPISDFGLDEQRTPFCSTFFRRYGSSERQGRVLRQKK